MCQAALLQRQDCEVAMLCIFGLSRLSVFHVLC